VLRCMKQEKEPKTEEEEERRSWLGARVSFV
jgi:hypothetical protein